MIDGSIRAALWPVVWFYTRQILWLYVWPVVVGFLTIAGYQMCGRVAMRGKSRWALFFLASGTAALSLFGWATIVRSVRMIPLYGLGVGLAYVIMSRVYAVTLKPHGWFKVRLPHVVWRGNVEAVERIRQRLGVPGA